MRREPALRDHARQTLTRWRRQSGATPSDVLWDEWEQLLANEQILALESAVLVESDHGQLLRSVSPLGGLVPQSERTMLLKQAREQVASQ